jgi:hypothetical protein
MVDQTYLVTLKPPSQATQHVVESIVEVHGDHLVFEDAEGKLAALFLPDLVESWDVLPHSILSLPPTRLPETRALIIQ